MKKYLPVLLLVFGVIAVGAVFVLSRNNAPTNEVIEEEEEVAPEVPFDQRPLVSLTPKADGHWLTLSIQNASRVSGATTMDYELLYTTSDDRQQGGSGRVTLSTSPNVTRDMLLGSESSGKFRYDQGVEKGTLVLRFRNEKAKLVGKLTTEWHLQTGVDTLTSVDGKFTYKLSKLPKKGYFVTMNTLGVPQGVNGTLSQGPYGVFASETTPFPGTVTLSGGKIWGWLDASWVSLPESGTATDLGVFVTAS